MRIVYASTWFLTIRLIILIIGEEIMCFTEDSLVILREEKEIGYIYGLFDTDDNLLYIGQTKSIKTRTDFHFSDKPRVEYCKYTKFPLEYLSEYEAKFILKYLPEYNRTIPPNFWFYTIDQYQKKDIRFYSRKVFVLRNLKNIESNSGYYYVKDLEHISSLLDNYEVSK